MLLFRPRFSINKQFKLSKYRDATEGYQSAYCCCADCNDCLTAPIDYAILDSIHTQILGNIKKVNFLIEIKKC